jgi:selenocysteine-specific elongation factor
VVGDVEIDEGYSHELAPRASMHVNVGLQMIPAQFTPFREEGETRSVVDDAHAGERCGAVLKLQEASVAERGDRLLLMRIDLPPKSSRVVGSLVVTEMLSAAPTLFRKKLREGVVAEKLDEGRFLVRGLFASASGATRYVGSVVSCGEFDGRIISAYGQDGGALVETGRDLSIGSKVSFVSFRRFEL